MNDDWRGAPAGLTWIGKEAVARHDVGVPFCLLQDVPELLLTFWISACRAA